MKRPAIGLVGAFGLGQAGAWIYYGILKESWQFAAVFLVGTGWICLVFREILRIIGLQYAKQGRTPVGWKQACAFLFFHKGWKQLPGRLWKGYGYWILLAFFCLFAGFYRTMEDIRPDAFESHLDTLDIEGAQVSFWGTLESVRETEYGYKGILKEVKAEHQGQRYSLESKVLWYGESISGESGDSVAGTGFLSGLEASDNPGSFNVRLYYQGLSVEYQLEMDKVQVFQVGKKNLQTLFRSWGDRLAAYFIEKTEETSHPEDGGVFCALVLGDTTALSDEVEERYRENGLIHILVISGVCTLSLVSLRPP